ncbi:hypothetical protein NL676_004297 [Syzygium grande]|nr:hypothetical protein NL676_004297 [Syzygium grande]
MVDVEMDDRDLVNVLLGVKCQAPQSIKANDQPTEPVTVDTLDLANPMANDGGLIGDPRHDFIVVEENCMNRKHIALKIE